MEDRTIEIEKLAWQIFLDRLGLSLKRELTAEEKKGITDKPEYQEYRAAAEKQYTERLRKKEKAVLNKKYPVIDVPASGKPDWSGGAYVLCFVYSRYKGNFVLRGYYKEVQEYLKENYTHYFCNYSLWHLGQNRDIWHFWKKDIGVFDVSIKERRKGKKTEIRPWRNPEMTEEELKTKTFKFRRLPKRWIPEFDIL